MLIIAVESGSGINTVGFEVSDSDVVVDGAEAVSDGIAA